MVAFFYEHASFSYNQLRETAEDGHMRCARELAEVWRAFEADENVFAVWREDDIGSWSDFDDVDRSDCDPYPFYECLLCVDCDYPGDLVRGYDPRDGIFERPGRVVECVGGVDFGEQGSTDDPYARVIVAQLYEELQARRENAITRGEN